jgi:hypothetical protein
MKPGKRLDYLESGKPLPKPQARIEEFEPLDPTAHYPLLARYDFAGRGPRPGIKADQHMFEMAMSLQTRGERLASILLRMAWALVRLGIGLIILYFILWGNNFNCAGSRIYFR